METRRDRRKAARQPNKGLMLIVALAVVVVAAGVIVTVNVVTDRMEQRRLEMEHQAKLEKYPLLYPELIEHYSAEYGLDPAFIASIIWCESTFNSDAVSSAGARGLMQIMPDTGKWLAGKFDEEDNFDPEQLFDPETNIRYACWYLSYLSGLFDSNLQNMAAAYHAGQGTVTDWLANPAISEDGKTLHDIPDSNPQTSNYIGKVTQTMGIYRELYFPAGEEAL